MIFRKWNRLCRVRVDAGEESLSSTLQLLSVQLLLRRRNKLICGAAGNWVSRFGTRSRLAERSGPVRSVNNMTAPEEAIHGWPSDLRSVSELAATAERDAASRAANGAMSSDGPGTIRSRIKNLLRSPSIKLRRSGPARNKHDLSKKVRAHKRHALTHRRQHNGVLGVCFLQVYCVSELPQDHYLLFFTLKIPK